MTPTNESIGRPEMSATQYDCLGGIIERLIKIAYLADRVFVGDTEHAINREVDALKAYRAELQKESLARELDRQAPGVPDWQSVADQMAAAIAPGEWVMVPRRMTGSMAHAMLDCLGRQSPSPQDAWTATLSAVPQPAPRVTQAMVDDQRQTVEELRSIRDRIPQPPAQEQGEVETLARRLELEASALIGLLGRTDDSSDVRVMRDAATALRGRLHQCTMGVGDGSGQLFVHGSYEAIKACQALVTRAAGAEDARDG